MNDSTRALLQLALSKPKPSKATAVDIIFELLAKHPDELNNLAALYAFFQPAKKAKNHADTDPLAWVTQAVSQGDVREYLRYLGSDGTTIVGTNGHRIHCAPTTLPAGMYDPVSGERIWSLEYDIAEQGHPGKYPMEMMLRRYGPGVKGLTKYPLSDVKQEVHSIVGKPEKPSDYILRLSAGDHVAYVVKRYWDEAVRLGDGAHTYVLFPDEDPSDEVYLNNTAHSTWACIMCYRVK